MWFGVWGGKVVEADVDVEFLGEFDEGSGGGVGAWSGYPGGPVVGYFDLVAGGGDGGGAVLFLLDRPSEFAEGLEDSVWVVDVPCYRRGSPPGGSEGEVEYLFGPLDVVLGGCPGLGIDFFDDVADEEECGGRYGG